jgi:hypothetical protein
MAMRPLSEEETYIQKALAGEVDAFGTLVEHYQNYTHPLTPTSHCRVLA